MLLSSPKIIYCGLIRYYNELASKVEYIFHFIDEFVSHGVGVNREQGKLYVYENPMNSVRFRFNGVTQLGTAETSPSHRTELAGKLQDGLFAIAEDIILAETHAGSATAFHSLFNILPDKLQDKFRHTACRRLSITLKTNLANKIFV